MTSSRDKKPTTPSPTPKGRSGRRKQLARQGRRHNVDRRTTKGLRLALPGGPRFKGDLCSARGRLADGTDWDCPDRRAAHGLCAKHALELVEGKAPPFTPPLTIAPRPKKPGVGHRSQKMPGIYYPHGDDTAWVRVTDDRKGRPDRWALIDATDIDKVGAWEHYFHKGQRLRRRRYHWTVAEDHNGRTWWAVDRHTKVPMHRVLLGRPEAGMTIDHADRQGWNNRRDNLAPATYDEQAANRTLPSEPRPPRPRTCVGCNHAAQIVPGLRRGNNSCPACLHADLKHSQGDDTHPRPHHPRRPDAG